MRITLEKVHALPSNYCIKGLMWKHYVWLDDDDRKPLASIGIASTDETLLDDTIYKDSLRWGKTQQERMAAEFKKKGCDKEIQDAVKTIKKKYRWQKLKLWLLRRKDELASLNRMMDYEAIEELGFPLNWEEQRYFLKIYRLKRVGLKQEHIEKLTYQQIIDSTVATLIKLSNTENEVISYGYREAKSEPLDFSKENRELTEQKKLAFDGNDFRMRKNETN